MTHRTPALVIAALASAVVVASPASASAGVSGKSGGYSLRLVKPLGALTIPKDKVSSGGGDLWTVECAQGGATPQMVMGVAPVSGGQRTLHAPTVKVPARGSLCRVLLNHQRVATMRMH